MERQYLSIGIAVLTISDTRDESSDTSGALLIERLQASGHRLCDRCIVKDDIHQIREHLTRWILSDSVNVVLTTGGTGVTGRDGTPEAVRPLLEKELEGFGEIFRWVSYQEIGSSALQSRAMAGVANGTYVFCLPGSRNACATAWDRIIREQLDDRTRPCNLVELMPRLREV